MVILSQMEYRIFYISNPLLLETYDLRCAHQQDGYISFAYKLESWLYFMRRFACEDIIHISWQNVKFYLILANDPGLFPGYAFIPGSVKIIAECLFNLSGSKLMLQCLRFKSNFKFLVLKNALSYPMSINEGLLEFFDKVKWLPSAANSEFLANIDASVHEDEISPIFKLKVCKLIETMEEAMFASFNLVFRASSMKVEEKDPEVLSKLHVSFSLYVVAIF